MLGVLAARSLDDVQLRTSFFILWRALSYSRQIARYKCAVLVDMGLRANTVRLSRLLLEVRCLNGATRELLRFNATRTCAESQHYLPESKLL